MPSSPRARVKMNKFAFSLLLVLLTPFAAIAGVPAGETSEHELVVMNVAAHPDDEDGRTLAFYRWAKDARAYSVIYTRGEGGQNEIGPELYEELGAIRTRETEHAARILGTQVYFLNYPDFGFSRTAEETFDRWGGRDAVTARIAYLIRKLKPDVIFTNHNTSTGHGHHQAVGISTYDAFALAADPQFYPEQLEEEGVDLWQPKRLFLRHWSRPDTFSTAVPVGEEHEAGTTYADLAAHALREHASQGMSMFAGRFFDTPTTYFTLLRKADDAPLDLNDLAGNLLLERKPAPSLRYLIDSRRLAPLEPGAIRLSDSLAVPGARVKIVFDPSRFASLPVRVRLTGSVDTTLLLSEGLRTDAELRIPAGATPTYPPVSYQYERFISTPPVAYGVEDVSSGQRLAGGYLPLEIAPPYLIEPTEQVVRITEQSVRAPLRLSVWAESVEQVTVRGAVSSPHDGDVLGETYASIPADMGAAVPETLAITLPGGVPTGAYTITLTAAAEGARALHPTHHFLTARAFDVRVPQNLRVGVVASYDNSLATALSHLDVEHVLLDSVQLATGDFSNLNTILIDIRAYLVRQDLRIHNDRLLEWVRRGGNLVVNYHKTFEWNEGEADPFLHGHTNDQSFAPYPIRLGRARVTREDAPVTVLQPEHPFLTAPNQILDEDWEGWVQERGLYFPDEYDERYLELFSVNDPGDSPRLGSTLFTQYGDGTYTYTALVWYRQLKELHPGAFKVFANMISLPLVRDGYGGAAASTAD